MTETSSPTPGRWLEGALPPNVQLGNDTVISSDLAFKRFKSRRANALVVGHRSTLDGVHFAIGEQGNVTIGDGCFFSNAVLLCELEIRIGNFVLLGWNVTVADTDFHPIDPAQRVEDAIACSPLSGGRPRPPIQREPVVIEDEVYVGPNATILKGVRIGRGAFVEPGSLVTKDVAPYTRVMGNPARVVGEVGRS